MERIRWGVLGTADIARGCTIPGMQLAENCELYAIAGRSLEKAESYRKEFGFEKAYGSYEALLNDPEVQAVYIPLPNHLHKQWSIAAMRAGKHVLCEKPLAPTAADAEEMIAVSKECGVHLMEAFAYLHSPVIRAIQAEIQSGAIGELAYMETTFTTETHDLANIRMRKETFGGSLYDLGCYCTSLILRMFGEEPETVKAVASFSPEGIDTLSVGLMTFSGGRSAMFNCGMTLAPDGGRLDRMIFHGSKGSIVTATEFNQSGELCYTLRNADGTAVKKVSVPQNYSLEVTQLGKCIADGETPFVSHDFTTMNARTIDRLLKEIGY